MITALQRLPQRTKDEVIEQLKIEIQSIDLKQEITLKDQAGNYRAPMTRKHRRNVEIMLHFMMRPELDKLEDTLMTAPNLDVVIQAVDKYFAQLDRVMAPSRGNYSFHRPARDCRDDPAQIRKAIGK